MYRGALSRALSVGGGSDYVGLLGDDDYAGDRRWFVRHRGLSFRRLNLQKDLLESECVMAKDEFEGLPVIDAPDSENITVVVKPDDLAEGDMDDPERHPIAIALRRRKGINDARASKREVLIRRGGQWFRYGAPKRVP